MPNVSEVFRNTKNGFKYTVYHISSIEKAIPKDKSSVTVFLEWVDGQRLPVFSFQSPEKLIAVPLAHFDRLFKPETV